MIKIYHNPRCMKSRETLAIINEKGVDVDVIPYLEYQFSKKELKSILKSLQMKPLELIRTKDKFFKAEYAGKDMSDMEWIEAMIKNPILIERPIVVKGKEAIIGRPPENVLKFL